MEETLGILMPTRGIAYASRAIAPSSQCFATFLLCFARVKTQHLINRLELVGHGVGSAEISRSDPRLKHVDLS